MATPSSLWDGGTSLWDGDTSFWDPVSNTGWGCPVGNQESYDCTETDEEVWGIPDNQQEFWNCDHQIQTPPGGPGTIPPPVDPPPTECPEITCNSIETDGHAFSYPGLIGFGEYGFGAFDTIENVASPGLEIVASPIVSVRTSLTTPNLAYSNTMRLGFDDVSMDPSYQCINGDVFTGVFYNADNWEFEGMQGVDIMLEYTMDDANNRIDAEMTLFNVSGQQLDDVSVGIGNHPFISGVEFSTVRNSERSFTTSIVGFTATIGMEMQDDGFTYITRLGDDYTEYKFYDPSYTFATPDSTSQRYGGAIAVNTGSLAIDGCVTIHFSYIFG